MEGENAVIKCYFYLLDNILRLSTLEGTKGYKQFWLLQLQQNYRRTTFVEKTGGKILEVGVKYLIGDTLKVSW